MFEARLYCANISVSETLVSRGSFWSMNCSVVCWLSTVNLTWNIPGGAQGPMAGLPPSRTIPGNVIAPGYIETDMTAFLTDEQKDNIIEQLSIKRIGKPEDIANIVSFLCTDESEYITGQVISVDGGITS